MHIATPGEGGTLIVSYIRRFGHFWGSKFEFDEIIRSVHTEKLQGKEP